MTIEEKAKAYDEAIEKVKPLYGRAKKDDSPIWATYEYLFPQLCENENEKIRKELLAVMNDLVLPDEQKARFNTWLERQKDADKAIEAVEKIDKYIDEHLANAHDMKDSNPDKKYYRGWDDALGEMSRILQDVYSGEKQKERKPVECIEFDNEFEKQVSHLLASVLNGEWEYNEDFVKYAAQSLLGYAKQEQKPAEVDEYEIIKKHITEDVLSSEVNKRLKECGWYVTDEKPEERNKVTINGEPIPTENQSIDIPLAEWSEEDEIRRESCIMYLANARDGIEFSQHIGDNAKESGKKEIQKDINWLKDLPLSLKREDERNWRFSIPDYINPSALNLKNEWSEDDDEAYKFVTALINSLVWRKDWVISKDKCLKMLEALRLQPHMVSIKNATKFGNLEYERGVKDGIQSEKSRQWKPSDEQLRPLEYAIEYFKKKGNDTTYLESLYNDLQRTNRQ